MPGKRVAFDDETWQALDLLARDTMKTFPELADEAFADLLRKYDRPVGLTAALRRSAGHSATVTPIASRRPPAATDKAPARSTRGRKTERPTGSKRTRKKTRR